MIEFKNVDFGYSDRLILCDISFKVAKNESVAIMGPSGSGKSTILRLLLGLECPHRGTITIDGMNICQMKEREKREIRKTMGMVFQNGALFDSLTVGENVGYYLIEHSDLEYAEISARVHEMIGFVGLNADEIIDKLPDELSGGMQRRVAIARALLSTNPKVMMYDEPTTGLDPESTKNILQLMQKLKKEREVSSLMVTHQIADAVSIADKFIVISGGEIAYDGKLDGLIRSKDERVVTFLTPFIESLAEVNREQFTSD